jgi:hypothetical protein
MLLHLLGHITSSAQGNYTRDVLDSYQRAVGAAGDVSQSRHAGVTHMYVLLLTCVYGRTGARQQQTPQDK